ncbi:hypothetical protein U1Q18_013858 [Sarracenia purpurea var. burkii]
MSTTGETPQSRPLPPTAFEPQQQQPSPTKLLMIWILVWYNQELDEHDDVMSWSCLGAVLDLVSTCFGAALELFFALFWSCLGVVLELFWTCYGNIFLTNFRAALEHFYCYF